MSRESVCMGRQKEVRNGPGYRDWTQPMGHQIQSFLLTPTYAMN